MPGPCNNRRKKKQNTKRDKKNSSDKRDPSPPEHPHDDDPHLHECPDDSPAPSDGGVFIATPNIYDPGNGPRVRDTRTFLSSFFAHPPALDDPLCAEFAQEEILQMLCTALPEETAIVRLSARGDSRTPTFIQILWYNKSRTIGRVCPCCRRLYSLGDVLPDLVQDTPKSSPETQSPYLAREQEISGLCTRSPSYATIIDDSLVGSPLCFIMASFNHPGAIKTTWGRVAEEVDDYTWELLNSPGSGAGDQGLSLLVKMARLPDLGLGQLCMPDVDFESDG